MSRKQVTSLLLNFLSNSEFAKENVIWFELLKQHAQLALEKINGAVGPCCAVESSSTGLPSLLTTA